MLDMSPDPSKTMTLGHVSFVTGLSHNKAGCREQMFYKGALKVRTHLTPYPGAPSLPTRFFSLLFNSSLLFEWGLNLINVGAPQSCLKFCLSQLIPGFMHLYPLS